MLKEYKSHIFTHANTKRGTAEYTVILSCSTTDSLWCLNLFKRDMFIARQVESYADFTNLEPDGHSADHLTDFIKQMK